MFSPIQVISSGCKTEHYELTCSTLAVSIVNIFVIDIQIHHLVIRNLIVLQKVWFLGKNICDSQKSSAVYLVSKITISGNFVFVNLCYLNIAQSFLPNHCAQHLTSKTELKVMHLVLTEASTGFSK